MVVVLRAVGEWSASALLPFMSLEYTSARKRRQSGAAKHSYLPHAPHTYTHT